MKVLCQTHNCYHDRKKYFPRSDEVKIKTKGEESEKQEEQTRLTIEEEYNSCHSTNYRSYPLEDIYETGDMTQTIDSTHYEMIETDRQGNKAYINVDIKKYVDCIKP